MGLGLAAQKLAGPPCSTVLVVAACQQSATPQKGGHSIPCSRFGRRKETRRAPPQHYKQNNHGPAENCNVDFKKQKNCNYYANHHHCFKSNWMELHKQAAGLRTTKGSVEREQVNSRTKDLSKSKRVSTGSLLTPPRRTLPLSAQYNPQVFKELYKVSYESSCASN
jgi:hypothetical protein